MSKLPFPFLLALATLFSAAALAAPPDNRPAPANIVRVMETVADWQLSHPTSFDIFSHRPGEKSWRITRVSWNGDILVNRPCNPRPDPDGLSEEWRRLAFLERSDASFCEIPPATQTAWLKETGLAPENVKLIQMLDGSTRGWEMGVLYHGLLALDTVSSKRTCITALRHIGKSNDWRLGGRIYHADDHVPGYMYLACYEADKTPETIADVQSSFDWIMRNKPEQPMTIKFGQRRWTWCDALFMSPPVWARLARITGDRAYLDFMDAEWWAVTAHLYSPEDKLFYRDANFFDRREKNSAKVFWARGNGWVLAALPRVLDEMPADYPSRAKYIQLYKDMAGRIASLQPSDGLWRSSLLDPEAFTSPEVSSSAFFCFALAWGINNGHLERSQYEPLVLKTWDALVRRVQSDGHLGYIQQPAAAPGSAGPESTAPYGVGAFLLAGAEMHRLLTTSVE